MADVTRHGGELQTADDAWSAATLRADVVARRILVFQVAEVAW